MKNHNGWWRLILKKIHQKIPIDMSNFDELMKNDVNMTLAW
jgi:hypothetical protein